MLKYDIPQDYVSWHFIFPHKVSWKWQPFCFLPRKQSKLKKQKKEEKIIIFMKFMEKEVKKVGSRRIWSYDQKNCLVLPTSSYTLSKTAHVNYYKILYLTFLKLVSNNMILQWAIWGCLFNTLISNYLPQLWVNWHTFLRWVTAHWSCWWAKN